MALQLQPRNIPLLALFAFALAIGPGAPAHAGPVVAHLTPGGQPVLVQQARDDFSVQNAAGPPDASLPLRVTLGSFAVSTAPDREEPAVIISGLPEGFRLSAGKKKLWSWAVPLDKLDGLTIIPPPGYEGDFKLLAMLFDGKEFGDIKAATISIHRKHDSAPPFTPAEEEALLKKGDSFLKNGDLSAARLSYEALAARGSAQGAFALAQSYDPVVLSRITIAGLKPDLAKAKEWYKRAAELGSRDAFRRLGELEEIGVVSSYDAKIPTQ